MWSRNRLWVLLGLLFIVGDVAIRWLPFFSEIPQGLYGTSYWNTEWQGEPRQTDVLETEISHHANVFQHAVATASQNRFSIEWHGYIKIPRKGQRKFFTQSDDGSWLWIDDTLVVDNGGAHGLQEKRGKVDLTKGLHTITIRYVQMGGDAALRVFWEEENDQKVPLEADVLLPPTLNLLHYRPRVCKNTKGVLQDI